MKNFPDVSVIVPVYNAEKTIIRCVESICKQSYRNIEIILIDDGSSDKSYEICENYLVKIHVFMYIDKKIKACLLHVIMELIKLRGTIFVSWIQMIGWIPIM